MSNVDPERSRLNENWESNSVLSKEKGGRGLSIEKLKAEACEYYKKKQGRKAPGNAEFIRESVVVISNKNTMNDLKKFADLCNEKYGIKALGIWIHRDEGYHRSKFIEGDTKWKPNLHAHVLWYWQDPVTGKSLNLSRNDMRGMQDLAAEALGMARGERSEKRHITAHTFAQMQHEERIASLRRVAAENKEECEASNRAREKSSKEAQEAQKRLNELNRQLAMTERSVKAQKTQLANLQRQVEEKQKELANIPDPGGKRKELEGLEEKAKKRRKC